MKAYLEFMHSDEEAALFHKIGFGVKIIQGYLLESGFVRVVVDWNSKKDQDKIRYAQKSYVRSSSTKTVGVKLQFKDFPYTVEDSEHPFYPGFEVMLDYKDSDNKMEYISCEATKYQAIVYFGPEGWNFWTDKAKKIDF